VSRPLRGDDVATLQQRMADLGFDPGRVDGIFGTLTDRAVKDFQRNVGVAADGTCGPTTFVALDRLSRTVTGGLPVAMREHEAIRRGGPTLTGKVVVVDPGHGGPDRGVASRVEGVDVDEAYVAYDIATRVEGRLTALGVTAYLSRGGDPTSAIDEEARADFANSAAADLVVSLHAEALDPGEHACGCATYYYGGGRSGAHSAVGERLARLLQDEITTRTDLLDCRTHTKTWDLLRHTTMPAVRVEVGFLSHPGDAVRLADPSFRDVVAEAVVAGVQRLFTTQDLVVEADDPSVAVSAAAR